jgi:LPXTG-motif cell wall-anchored protein
MDVVYLRSDAMIKTLLKTAGCAAVGLTLMTASAQPAQAQVRGDKAVYFTFSQPVTLPQVTLPAGKYLFRLADSLVNRTIVQIYSADGSKLHAMLMTMPSRRADRPNDPEVRFLETAANTPPAIATYWYPGEQTGWEFVYPRQQAISLARTSQQPVLTTAQNATADEMRTAELARVSPTGDTVAVDVDANAPVAQPSAAAQVQRGEVATDAPPAPTVTARNTTADAAPRTRLPATASNTPAILVTGLLALSMAFGLGLWRRVRA